MKTNLCTVAVSLVTAMLLVGCNSSSSSSSNGSDDNGNGGQDNGSDVSDASTPAESVGFFRAAELNYTTLYSGNENWAEPENTASSAAGSPADQEQRVVADTGLLANALLMVPFRLDDALIQEYDLDEEDFYQVYGFAPCAGNTGSISFDDGTATVSNYCFTADRSDGAEIQIDGTFSYDESSGSEYSRQLTFEGLDIEWRGESFSANGKVADAVNTLEPDENIGPVSVAMDVDQVGGDSYRFWAGHVYILSRENPQINMIGLHPDHGGLAQLAEGMYADEDNCPDGGFDDGAGGTFAGPDDANYVLGFTHCDLYVFGAGQSTDSNGDEIVPELYAAYRSLGLDFGPAVEELEAVDDKQFQLAKDQSDSVDVTQPEIALLGEVFDANGDGHYYELALTIDLAELGSVDDDDVKAALLRVYQVDATEDSATGILRARRVEYTGDPTAGEFIGSDTDDLVSAAVALDSDWLTIDATDMVKAAMDDGKDELQLIITANYPVVGSPDEGERYREFCLSEGSSCDADQLPAISIGFDE